MGSMRTAAAAVLMWFAAAGSLYAQCESAVRLIEVPFSGTVLNPGASDWSGTVLAIASNRERDDAIYVSIYNELGDLLFRTSRVADTENAEIVDVVWNGDHFGVFYRDTDDNLVLLRIGTAAERLGSRTIEKFKVRDDDEVEIAWSPVEAMYVIARRVAAPSPSIWLTRVRRDGGFESNIRLADAAEDSLLELSLTTLGSVAVFYEHPSDRSVTMARIDEAENLRLRTVWDAGDDFVVTAVGEQFLLARTDSTDSRRTIRWKVVDLRGIEIRPEARLLFGTGKDVRAISLTPGDGEVAIAYLDARRGFDVDRATVRLHRFSPEDGAEIADAPFAPSATISHREATADEFFWTGRAYLMVATRESSDGDLNTFLIRSCRLEASISGPRAVRTGDTVTLTAAGEGGVPNYQYEWTWGAGQRATGPSLQQTFTTAGDYTFTVLVRDGANTETTATFTVTVTNTDPPPPVTGRRRAVRH
jgi:hypothetical protein